MKEQDAEIQEFQAYLEAEAKSQNKDPKSYIENLGEDGLKKAYQRFQDWKQKKTKKAAHGLKLNYIRRLKNQCEDGEVLVYYKTGGPLGCKCMKAQSGTEFPHEGLHKMSPERQEELKRSLRQNKGKNYRELVQRGLKKSKPKASTLPNTNNTPTTAKPIPLAKPKKINTIQSAESGKKIKSNCDGSKLFKKKLKFDGGGSMFDVVKTMGNQIMNGVKKAKKDVTKKVTKGGTGVRYQYGQDLGDADRYQVRGADEIRLPNGYTISKQTYSSENNAPFMDTTNPLDLQLSEYSIITPDGTQISTSSPYIRELTEMAKKQMRGFPRYAPRRMTSQNDQTDYESDMLPPVYADDRYGMEGGYNYGERFTDPYVMNPKFTPETRLVK